LIDEPNKAFDTADHMREMIKRNLPFRENFTSMPPAPNSAGLSAL